MVPGARVRIQRKEHMEIKHNIPIPPKQHYTGASGANNPAYTHGHTATKFSPEYQSWSCMIQRCTNPRRKSFEHYGGRGITVYPRWLTFAHFLADMGPRPEATSLDRIDVDGDYTPENCRWADRVVQARNSKQVVWVEIEGETRRLVEWCEHYSVSINTVRDRVKYYGLSYQEAILKPKRSK